MLAQSQFRFLALQTSPSRRDRRGVVAGYCDLRGLQSSAVLFCVLLPGLWPPSAIDADAPTGTRSAFYLETVTASSIGAASPALPPADVRRVPHTTWTSLVTDTTGGGSESVSEGRGSTSHLAEVRRRVPVISSPLLLFVLGVLRL